MRFVDIIKYYIHLPEQNKNIFLQFFDKTKENYEGKALNIIYYN